MTNAILMLNDFCFLEIFKHLSLHDLANVREAFKCLDAVTEMAFKRVTGGRLCFDGRPNCYVDYDLDGSKQIIKQFGSFVHTLSIVDVQDTKWKEIFSSINEHCKEKLTNLSLIGENVAFITKADVVLVIDILKNLETIKLNALAYEPTSSEFLEMLCYCEKVKSIDLGVLIDLDLHETIFRTNKNLLKLRLNCGLKGRDTKAIVDNLMNTQLEEMYIGSLSDDLSENFAELKRLKYLKHLKMNGYIKDITPFFQRLDTFDSLKILTLSTILNDRAIEKLGRMNRLKVLKLFFPLDSFKSLLVLCGNPNLEHLLFRCSFLSFFDRIDTASFLQIIEKRKASTSEKCFHLILSYTVYTASVEAIPFEMLEANKATIKLINEWDSIDEYSHI